MAFVPRIGLGWSRRAAFPSIVLETGYSESATSLEQDAILWCNGSSGAVKVVLLLKFQRVVNPDPMGAVLTVCRAFPNTNLNLNRDTTLFQDFVSFSPISIVLLSLLIC